MEITSGQNSTLIITLVWFSARSYLLNCKRNFVCCILENYLNKSWKITSKNKQGFQGSSLLVFSLLAFSKIRFNALLLTIKHGCNCVGSPLRSFMVFKCSFLKCVCLCMQLTQKTSFINNYVFGHPTRHCQLIKNPSYTFGNAVNLYVTQKSNQR